MQAPYSAGVIERYAAWVYESDEGTRGEWSTRGVHARRVDARDGNVSRRHRAAAVAAGRLVVAVADTGGIRDPFQDDDTCTTLR
jgi:hypothetical protein